MEDGEGAVRLRVVTFNCHGSIGADRRCDPDRTMAVIARLSPDILALQEVDGRSHFGRRERAFEFFQKELGPHIVEARTVGRTDRDYGHLLWSRWPIRQAAVHRLPGPGLETRAACDGRVDTPTGSVRVLGIHLGLLPFTRRRQAQALSALARQSPGPTIILGDSNDWRLAGAVHRLIGAELSMHVAPKSWPARQPAVRMDRIYAGHGLRLLDGFADTAADGASDHLPVVADFTLRQGGRDG